MSASLSEKLWALWTLLFAVFKFVIYAMVLALLGAGCWKLLDNPEAMSSAYYVIGGMVWCCFYKYLHLGLYVDIGLHV